MRRTLILTVTVAAVAGWSGPSWGADRVALVDVVIIGVPDDARTQLEEAIIEGLEGGGREVIPPGKVQPLLVQTGAPTGCTFGPCLQQVGRALGVTHVVTARVTAEGMSYNIVLTLVDTRTGVPQSQSLERCPVCTLDEARATITLTAVGLGTGVVARRVDVRKQVDLWRDRYDERASTLSATGWWLSGVSLGAMVGGIVLLDEDERAGWFTLGGGVGLFVSGIVLIAISR